ncbi:hypothetical protein SteCoe_6330 [Stentor coeruleus]|uniref:Uncharacterized protein n=1 Tax=Stentor coeruleus TaxID=5963 RepID=A0A1R2CQ88_9CILI|nr:hypothetical protein SteCoe_6330 [Stentor coeruleus]
MELKKNRSGKDFMKPFVDSEKINPLATFQRFPINQNPALYVHPSMPNIANIDELNPKHPAWTTKFFEKRSKNFTILPPIANTQRLKHYDSSQDVFTQVLLHNDCNTKGKHKAEEDKSNNLTHSEKKYESKPSEVIKYFTEGDFDDSFSIPKDKFLNLITDFDPIPTPTFNNSIVPESLPLRFSDIITFDKEVDNARSKSEIINKNKSHAHLLKTTFKAMPRKFTCKLPSDMKKIMSNSLPFHMKNEHQKIKVLKHGLPKDVFTVNGKN